MNFFEATSQLEETDDLHLGRLLLLLAAFSGRDGKGSIDGLTKLAKLDFLLRYPVNLERALEARNGRGDEAKVLDFERLSIESAMVRYRFGPWDFRYRRFVNILISKGLAEVKTKGRMIQLFLTEAGISAAKELASREEFAQIEERTRLLKRHCNLSATNLMKFIYETFPELSSMRAGKPIPQ